MNILKRTGKRVLALLLCLSLALSVPVLPTPSASAADWLTPYLDKMVSWDVVKGDGNGNYNTGNVITRAEFVAMMNRAYGYNDLGTMPFTDVTPWDWFYEDINKAYTAGIFQGTSDTTAEPYAPITREQAITLLARTMRMDEIPGEIIDFTDGRQFSSWSRGYVKAAIRAGIINGYEDGSCRPMQNLTRGEAIKMMCVGIGSLVNTPGTHAPGGVFGNVTINCTNVVLKDTIITGDLYISGGISLGDVVLENVQVRGRIVVAGGGSSELGQNSVILRGVDTNTLIIDAPTNQYVSVRTEGRTHITNGLFRSNAFLDDGCRDQYGILNVSLEGNPGDSFTLSGNLENVVNRTPDSTLILGDAQAAKVTIDEKATNSKLVLEVNASADEVNLDVGTSVEGSGDIDHLVINSEGSSTTMLPDKITIRPGLKGEISGEEMDASQAQEFSEEPRILSGYPKVENVAPTTADGINSTNKQGTIYWGLTTAAVGAIPDTEEGQHKLMSPSYGDGFLLSGNYPAESSNKDFAIPDGLKGLTASGTYFVSAVLVDSRGHISPVYSERFETPDDIVPAFSTQPYMSVVETDESDVTVMANKSCDLYYVLYPQGSTPPTQNDFLAYANLDDALGYGRIRMAKNRTETFPVNGKIPMGQTTPLDPLTELNEKATYDLYLWLCDSDGIKSSSITKLTFTTRDKTPPEFDTDMQQTTMGPTSVGVTGVINEPGTIYWVMVEVGSGREYPAKPQNWQDDPQYGDGTEEGYLKSEHAKMQVFNGTGGDFKGSIKTAGNTNANATINGLKSEKAYEFYYVAVDQANPGNFSESVKHFTVYTEDNTPPTAEITFSRVAPNTGTGTVPPQPYADADVRVEFSENILDGPTGRQPLQLYQTWKSPSSSSEEQKKARTNLIEFLEKNIKLYQMIGGNATDVSKDVLKYENVVIELNREGKLVITFPGSANETYKDAGHELGSGSTYYFEFTNNITDASMQKNPMRAPFQSPTFTTVSSLAVLGKTGLQPTVIPTTATGTAQTEDIDMIFSLTPESTSSAEDGLLWNMMLWFNISCDFNLYRRERPTSGDVAEGWKKVGVGKALADSQSQGGASLMTIKPNNTLPFEVKGKGEDNLKDGGTVYEYALHFTKVGLATDRDTFNDSITCEVSVLTGERFSLTNLSNTCDRSEMDDLIRRGDITDISSPNGFTLRTDFTDKSAPDFAGGRPTFLPGDQGVEISVSLERPGTVYYVIAKAGSVTVRNKSGDIITDSHVDKTSHIEFPENGASEITSDFKNQLPLTSPSNEQVFSGTALGNDIIKGSLPGDNGTNTAIIREGLEADTDYHVFMVTRSSANQLSDTHVYHFKTKKVVRPIIEANYGQNQVNIMSNLTADVHYMVLLRDDAALKYSIKGASLASTDLFKEIATDKYTSDTKTTVLDALRTNERASDGVTSAGSLYDLYTEEDSYKNALAQRTRGQGQTGGVTAFGRTPESQPIPAGGRYTIDCNTLNMSPGQQYVLVAVGKSPSGSGDGFCAVDIELQDVQCPQIKSATGLDYDPVAGEISGTLVLDFGEPLYYYDQKLDQDNRLHTLCNHDMDKHPMATNIPEKDKPVSMRHVIAQCTNGVQPLYADKDKDNCTHISTMAFDFNKLTNPSGSSIISFQASRISDARNNTITSLTITVRVVNGNIKIDMACEPKNVDARINKT